MFYAGQPNSKRPTLDELLEAGGSRSGSIKDKKRLSKRDLNVANEGENEPRNADEGKNGVKLGWIKGVYIPCLLNIWGVMLFLRLTWVIGQAGLIEGLLLITLANAVTIITALSMSAVTTNGQIRGGGIYYMISRSLGPEFGGAVGLMFTAANSIAVSMYTIGFCESVLDMLKEVEPGFCGILGESLVLGRINDIRLLGTATLVIILLIALIGMNWVTRVQIFLLFLLLLSQCDFIIGTFFPPSDFDRVRGFVGYNSNTLSRNLWSGYEEGQNFFSVFAVFFPAVTGIVAGANLSGDLRDPAEAIPKGTLLAIFTTFASYIVYGISIASSALRYASGIEGDSDYSNCTLNDCHSGTLVSQQMMKLMSLWEPLIYAGCFAATLSSAIASLVGAPRVFQAVAKDKLFPGISCFAKGTGVNNDPLRGYFMVFVISLTCIIIGDLNKVSSLLSNFFVATYAVINYAVFHASINKSPGWRPSFKYFNKWISLLGTVLCIFVMVLMDYKTALVTLICIMILYIFVRTRHPNVNWGSSSQSESFVSALKAVHALAKVEDHVKNYRPKLIVMAGNPADRPLLMDFANLITKRISLLELVHIVHEDVDSKTMKNMKLETDEWLAKNHIKGFYSLTRNSSFCDGVRSAIELSGLGKLSPNMMLIGFEEHWWLYPDYAEEYVKTLQIAFDMNLSVGVLRVHGGLDISEIANSHQIVTETSRQVSDNSDVSLDAMAKEEAGAAAAAMEEAHANPIDERILQKMTQFRDKTQKEGLIDVYWLYDDGGLTLLLPYILSTRTKFAKCKLRVFFLSNSNENSRDEGAKMAALLEKFRIEYQDVVLLADATRKPQNQTRDEFSRIVRPHKRVSSAQNMSMSSLDSASSCETADGDAFAGPDEEIAKHEDKTLFHLRIAEIAREKSETSSLVIMTLPMPKKELPSGLYMAWIDFMTRNMPPFLLVRGNQESVLTFYS